jgi:malonyl CoA-acyl carrier protein transacylase
MVGHSTGEHSALLAAGVVEAKDEAELIRHIRGVNGVFESLKSSSDIPEGILLAVAGCDHALLESLAASSGGKLHIALDNCPHQVVMCGSESAINQCMQELAGKAAVCQKLPFSRAYHTPWFEVFSQPLRRYFDTATIGPSRVALYSCVTGRRYSEDPDEIRELTSIGWARTVRFRETVEAMYQDGVRIFVEAGPRGNLTGFIDDTLRGKSYIASPANMQHRSGILQLHHLIAQLVAHGVPVCLDHLYQRRAPRQVERNPKAVRPGLAIVSGLKPVRLGEGFKLPARTPATAPQVSAPTSEIRTASLPSIEAAAPPSDTARMAVIDQHFQTMARFLETQKQVMHAYLAGRDPAMAAPEISPGPFITEVLELLPGARARARHKFSFDREPLFRDHTLGRHVSKSDPTLSGLPVVPLTITMEILAECGALLEPGKVLVGMREFRAYRWITLDRPDVTLEITAEQREPGKIYVALREETGSPSARPLWAEGTMFYADEYPGAPVPADFVLEAAGVSRWRPDRLYVDGMFHGPSFQAVRSIDQTGKNGVTASLQVPPRDGLFAAMPEPAFLTDPVILDAAGQVVAFWSQERLDATGDIFPYHLAALDCYAPPLEPGSKLECRVLVTHVSDKEIRSGIEILDSQARVLYRLDSWEDRRFPQASNFWKLRISPRDGYLSSPWQEPIASFLDHQRLACRRLDSFAKDFFEASHGIWPKVLAHLVLGRNEREHWQSMQAVDKRRHEWLLGRCAAKDAVRALVKEHFGVDLCPADVEIIPDGYGRPQVAGAWTRQIGMTPAVSISHTNGMAVALASLEPGQMVGIDIESLTRSRDDFESIAFSEPERRILAGMPQDVRDEWSLRMWCAKEAVAKALGRGFTGGMQALQISEAEVENGVVQLHLQGGLLQEFTQLRGRPMIAYTSRGKDFVFSTIVYQQGAVQ